GTAADLARWSTFLADPAKVDPDGAGLAPETLDEMRWPLTMSDETLWQVGFGLGLILVDEGERRIDDGHDGAVRGLLAGVEGRRHARRAGAAAARPPAGCAETGPDVLRTVCGREAGELLRLTRDPAGAEVVRMHWATYRFTRGQETFESC